MEGRKRDISGMAVCSIMIILACVAIWDTTSMLDPDSYVYPRTVAYVMIALCLVYITWNLVLPPKEIGRSIEEQATKRGGSTPRRVGLVLVMLASTAMMPVMGFYLAGLITFAALMFIAMYDEWTKFRMLVYPLVCVAVVTGFFLLFSKALLVPLPEAPFLG